MLWIGILIILASLNIVQYKMKRQRDRNLKYITEKLSVMLNEHEADQILLGTADKVLRALLVQINLFVEEHQHITARFAKTEQSMKRMLTNMSHDLKTPLTVVLGYIEAIQNDSDMAEEERERLLEKLYQKTGEIIQLMNSFFDLAKLESEDKQILLTKIHINEICRKTFSNTMMPFRQKVLKLSSTSRIPRFMHMEMKKRLTGFCKTFYQMRFNMVQTES
ncbi:two-component sensor histidine kinase YcbL [Bacillus licheniformis]|nr:two-component sensor histidine kinase YcbL [Bacillus licheniformis]